MTLTQTTMKHILLCVLLAFNSAAYATSLSVTPVAQQLAPVPEQSKAAHLAAEILIQHHYIRVPLDDATSLKIFDNYIKAIDGERLYFLQADIKRFDYARTKLDDAILAEDLSIPFDIFNLYMQRVAERLAYASSLLKEGFDFERMENYQYERKNAPWAKTNAEIDDVWRKRVKNDWLRLKLAGKDNKNIADTLSKRYEQVLKGVYKVKAEDAFQSFMNAYTTAIDPHTNYFGMRAAENFDISMRLSLFGIGAVLQTKEEYTTIREIVAGSPAALSGKLKAGDRIMGVGQGENGAIVDVTGWRLDDAVVLIRGPEDTIVLLDVLPAEAGPDDKHKLISLIRKKISLDNQSAKKSILEVKDGNVTRHIGVIALPGFYQDFAAHQRGEKDYKSATRDVSILLAELKRDKVDSVLIDLRNNGGGSLEEAIELTGLFINKGPVVQQRDSKGNVKVNSDEVAGLVWDGPLGVLINRGSASASEIFAAAIQDYGRGVVIGETSFGKGTVQTVVDLDRLAKNEKPKFGEIKMTIAQFFRINGGTTQLRGVIPDIKLPTLTDADDFGEASFNNALPWSKIQAAQYSSAGDVKTIVPKLIARQEARMSKDKDFGYLREDIARFEAQRKKGYISLNETVRRKEREAEEARVKSREKDDPVDKASTGLAQGARDRKMMDAKRTAFEDDGLQANERNLATDLANEKIRKDAKDIFLNEAVHILSDEVGMIKANHKLSARVLQLAQ